MSYQVLARKWRPNNFSELVGQEHVVSAISNALDNNRLHHAYLFSGTRGVGKTTIARIFSKSLNCEQGMGSKPCGQCSTCVEIEQGNFVDLLEIDAASRTKVEDTRELLDNVQYRPTRGRFKVYLIDEVHMLSKHSFNALLKTLEEPPPHVKFLLATTDPQKLPVTILSRCLQFNLKALSRSQISQQLQHILQQENIPCETDALAQLARAAQGSMRDSLSLTDQAIAQGNGQVSLQIVTDMLGLMDKNQVLKLLNSVIQKDAQAVLAQIEQMSFQAPDYGQVMAELMSLLHQIALTQFVPDACKLETTSARAIYQLANSVAPEQVQLLYQIALQGKKDLPFAADGRSGLEMTLIRMLAFSPQGGKMSSADIANTAPSIEHARQMPTQSRSESTHQPVEQITAPVPHLPESEISQASMAEVEYAEQLFAQQEDLLKQAEDMHPQFNQYGTEQDLNAAAFTFEGMDSSSAIEPAERPSEPAEEVSSSSATAALLALKSKLRAGPQDSQEQHPPVKKSEVIEVSPPGEVTLEPATKHIQVEDSKDEAIVEHYEDFAEEFTADPEQELDDDLVDEELDRAFIAANSVHSDFDTPPWAMESPANLVSNSLDEEAELAPSESVQIETNSEFAVDFDIPAFLANGDKVISAAQLDSWSKLIEQMQVTALTKQLALHASYRLENDVVTLCLPEGKQHLISDSACQQLQQALSDTLQRSIQLKIDIGTPVNTPYGVQQNVNLVRQQYAEEVVASDEAFVLLKQTFNAQVITDSIKPR
jgi:DNA polymerase III subunit gamma/tau